MTSHRLALLTAASLAGLALLGAGACRRDSASQPSAATTTTTEMPTLQPRELAQRLSQPGDTPLLFHVGFKKLYQQAHIPGSEFLGPTSDADAVDRLRRRAAELPRTREIVVYCGCCPWEHCPNVKPAFEALRDLGFVHVKVLYIAQDLGADWVAKGFPVAKGE
jgi:thiosulfate/3-mercaptopyruvate sulfurtransferase